MDRNALASSDIDELPLDIGGLQQMGERLRRENWLEAMIDHIPDFIYAKDVDGRFIFANKALVRNNGLADKRDLIGKTDFDFLPVEAAQSLTDIEQRVLSTGEPDLGFDELAELGDKNRWLMFSRLPLRSATGEIIGIVGASRDITVRKSAERLMKAQAHLLEIIARGTPLSSFLEEMVKTLASLKQGVYPVVLLPLSDSRKLSVTAHGTGRKYRHLAAAAGPDTDWPTAEYLARKATSLSKIFDETQIPSQSHSCRCFAIPGVDGKFEGVFALHSPDSLDLSDWTEFLTIIVNMTGIAIARHRAETRISFLAEHDALTGLPNRSLFDSQLNQAVATARGTNTAMTLAFLDVDDFKVVNDSLGHAAGDELLRIVGERISHLTLGAGSVARIGGDEFVIILQEFAAKNNFEILSEIRQAIALPAVLNGVEIKVTVSIGVASYPSHGSTAAELLVSADMAMYRAKQMGRDCIEVFDAEMAAAARRKQIKTEQLRQALVRREFVLHFQPQQDRQTGKIVGAEALIRWNHPTDGLIYPNDFISLAEETGLIVDIGNWVAQEACRVGKAWQISGIEPIRMSINVSARQFQEKRLVEAIAAALTDSGLDPTCLELELTESLIMKDIGGSISKMMELTKLGVSLAVDDFGTGYSSLSVLKKFPLSRLKIDRSFIADIPSDSDDMAITSAIISLAQKLGLKVIAEGVETEQQAQYLVDSGCHEIQGYLFSRPITEEDFGALLKRPTRSGSPI